MQAITQPATKLSPKLPSSNPRYDHIIAPRQAGFYLIPAQSIQNNISDVKQYEDRVRGWKTFIHPEGDLYHFDQLRRIVTGLDPMKLPQWTQTIDLVYQQVLRLLGVPSLPNSTELWINGPEPGTFDVGYYLADHDKRIIYWAEVVDARVLDLEPFGSQADLRGSLTSEYWVHVDYFPAHRSLDPEAEKTLIAALGHGCIDDMTSPGSTFPWSAEECRQFLGILQSFRDNDSEDNTAQRMSSIARLLAAISRVRHIHGYGTPNVRLDRFQGLSDFINSQTVPSIRLALMESVTFGHSNNLFRRMTELWNARVVYQRHWESFLSDMRTEWSQMNYFALTIWMACVIIFAAGKAGHLLFVSAWLAAAAILVSLHLQQEHSKDRLSTAPGISSWISRVEDTRHGLRPLSIKFSVPRALVIYAFVSLQLGLVLL